MKLNVSRYQGRWTKRRNGRLSLDDALTLTASRGVLIPENVRWVVAEDEGLTPREAGLEWDDEHGRVCGADASYFRIRVDVHNLGARVKWDQLKTALETITIALRAEVLESEEHAIYVISHELFELGELKIVFEERGGSMTYRELADLIEPALGGAIHENAVR